MTNLINLSMTQPQSVSIQILYNCNKNKFIMKKQQTKQFQIKVLKMMMTYIQLRKIMNIIISILKIKFQIAVLVMNLLQIKIITDYSRHFIYILFVLFIFYYV